MHNDIDSDPYLLFNGWYKDGYARHYHNWLWSLTLIRRAVLNLSLDTWSPLTNPILDLSNAKKKNDLKSAN